MILIVGGLGAGKRDFARRELGVREEELSPVLGPGTQVLYDLQALDPLPDLEELMGLRAVICNEVGCGLVPIQAEERQRREAVGRLCCQLAERAEAGYRISCGLAIRLK